MRITRVLRDL
jgi:hypothetical protein